MHSAEFGQQHTQRQGYVKPETGQLVRRLVSSVSLVGSDAKADAMTRNHVALVAVRVASTRFCVVVDLLVDTLIVQTSCQTNHQTLNGRVTVRKHPA